MNTIGSHLNRAIQRTADPSVRAPPVLQIRAPEAPREARRFKRPPLKNGAPSFCRFRASKPWRGLCG
eukprot:8269893-Alexandrium_andersonii.AAC.1